MSFSNNFVVEISDFPEYLTGYIGGGKDSTEFKEMIEFFCDEAQLPNINTATGTQNGLYLGLGSVDYPHTRIFTELQLGFALDANLSILKFLNSWYGAVFSNPNDVHGFDVKYSDQAPPENRVTRLAFKDEYCCTIRITKTESGPASTTQRKPITYVLEKAYPYAIDAIPLQFGSSQITKVTAQFKYQRHYTIERDITNVKDSAIYQPIQVVRGGGTELGVGANDLFGTSSGIA